MLDGLKSFQHCANDALRGGISCAQIRMRRFNRLQFLKESIVFSVRQLGLIQYVVQISVMIEQITQLFCTLRRSTHALCLRTFEVANFISYAVFCLKKKT